MFYIICAIIVFAFSGCSNNIKLNNDYKSFSTANNTTKSDTQIKQQSCSDIKNISKKHYESKVISTTTTTNKSVSENSDFNESSSKINKILDDSNSNNFEQQKKNVPMYRVSNKYDFVFAEVETSSDISDKINEAIGFLPNNIYQKFIKNKCKIILTDKNLNEIYFQNSNDNIVGCFIPNENIIYLNIDRCSLNNLREVCLHEIGHYFDYTFNNNAYNSENSNDWLSIYAVEKESLNQLMFSDAEYFMRTPKEYFAQMFMEYVINAYSVKDVAPLSYEYITNYITNIH